jgi:energy-coupling factor transporter ATP-binding protein EcfA2
VSLKDDAQPLPTISVPLTGREELVIALKPGEVYTVVGANGAGKSALATRIAAQVPIEQLRRVVAQRRLWFEKSGPDISASRRESLESMRYQETNAESRFIDRRDSERTDVTLFDLLGKIAAEDHRIADLSQSQRRTPEEIDHIVGERLFEVLNRVLRSAELLIQLELTDRQSFVAVRSDLGVKYPIAQMSDGERNALLLATEVLVTSPGSVIILDEPERHLHRSVSAGLIASLIEARPDSAFVILTHDLDLADTLSLHPGEVFAAVGVAWDGGEAVSWDLQKVTATAPQTEAARRAILGGRKKLLFIEGKDGSLDQKLYQVLFPGWTLAPSGGCEWVIRSVEGTKSAAQYHWIEARGIVDGDGRSADERAALRSKGVYPLPVSEVESLYYLPEVLDDVTKRVSAVDGGDAAARLQKAKADGIQALIANDGLVRAAKKLAKDKLVRKVVDAIPLEITAQEVTLTVPNSFASYSAELTDMANRQDYRGLVTLVSVRNSGFRDRVAKAVGLDSFARYEASAIMAIRESEKLRQFLRATISPELSDSIHAGPSNSDAPKEVTHDLAQGPGTL